MFQSFTNLPKGCQINRLPIVNESINNLPTSLVTYPDPCLKPIKGMIDLLILDGAFSKCQITLKSKKPNR